MKGESFNKMNKVEKLAKNSLILSIGTFFPKLTTFITLPILTGYLSKAEYGQYDLFIILASLVLPAATLQIQTGAFRFLIDIRGNRLKEDEIITNIYAFLIPVSLLVLVIVYFCFYIVDCDVNLFVCIYFFVDILYATVGQIARGLSYNGIYSIAALLNSCGSMIFAILFVREFNAGLVGGIVALMFSYFIAFLYIAMKIHLFQRIKIKFINIHIIKELVRYSWPMVPNSMSMWIVRVSDRIVVTFFLGVTANAAYAVANRIPQILTLAQNTFMMAWQENASIALKEENANAYYTYMFRVIFDIMAGFMSVLIAVSPALFTILIKGDYNEAYVQIPILLIGMFFYCIASFWGGIYVAFKDTRSVGITTFWAALCNLVTDLAMIHFIGLYAASISTLISYVALCIYRMINVRKLAKIDYDILHIVIVLIILLVQCILFIKASLLTICTNLVIGTTVCFLLNRRTLRQMGYSVMRKIKG